MKIYKFLKTILIEISNKYLRKYYKIMKLMIPFTPHLANECLEL